MHTNQQMGATVSEYKVSRVKSWFGHGEGAWGGGNPVPARLTLPRVVGPLRPSFDIFAIVRDVFELAIGVALSLVGEVR